jgi:hypothetical protein
MPKDRRNPMYGRKHSMVARALMSKAKVGVPKTEAHRAAISAAMEGKPKSRATRQKMMGRVPWNKGLKSKPTEGAEHITDRCASG